AGPGANAGAGETIRLGAPSGQLLWADPARALQRRAAAAGIDQQAGQFVSALFAGGSGPVGGAPGRGVGALLSSPGGAQTSRSGQGGGGAQAGNEVVPDVARGLDV